MPTRLPLYATPFRPSPSPRQAPWQLKQGHTARGSSLRAVSSASTWLTGNPTAVSTDDILSTLPDLRSSTQTKIPVLLLTPGFSSWIDPAHAFLDRCVNQLFKASPNATPPSTVHFVTAIVDKIPTPREKIESSSTADLESEGISLLLIDASNVQGKAASSRLVRDTQTEESALLLRTQAASSRQVYEVGLRLANTVFLTGKESTIAGMRWKYDDASEKFWLEKTVDLSKCVVKTTGENARASVSLPLYPVCQRRTVVSSMGNILRQISKPTTNGSVQPMPASSELEKDLPRYIKEHNIVDQRVSVWALVEGPDHLVDPTQETSHSRVIESIRRGGKLHRVVSGGGGWGKKQGLLSLDPEISFLEADQQETMPLLESLFTESHSTDTPVDLPLLFDQDTVDSLTTLSQVARQGDHIQFFVSVDPETIEYAHSEISQDAQAKITSYQFGVVADPEAAPGLNSTEESDLRIIPNYFGAASEKAMTYTQLNPEAESIVRTKLDIPGARVELSF
ncbi:hypothetical protein ASPZODRAFT_55295 [Penicilliopsis zonata CBS 506.65]|uniref:Uncharacterized protein n=1 Tax=Penicilliopsis zonata CBS 506.65 TaxID=1073090 RepID=A0A1L9SX21_9EURO|nr:hypothetical protein ASPZODRAFT_55295 [Penicilliopsis zonata CBS 506.65]OJJ51709.1 hypothetical protein ASPZODRAFT_55295 [Penicilliopsis zonata CBS 506.65]